MMQKLKRTSLVVSFIVVAALIWAVDSANSYSSGIMDGTIEKTAVIYASARGINAIVSVLQTVEVGAIVSISIGELLDPINDLIERFSTVITWCLAALALQKVMLAIAATKAFIWFVALWTGATILARLMRWGIAGFLGKVLLSIFAIRIGLSLIIVLNFAVSTWVLQPLIEEDHQNIEQFERELRGLQGELRAGIDQDITAVRQSMAEEDTQKVGLENLIASLESEITEVNAQLDILIEAAAEVQPWWDLTGPETPEILEAEAEIERLENHLAQARTDLGIALEAINRQVEDLECLEKEADGRSCSTMSMDNLLPNVGIGSLYSLGEKFESTALNLISLLVKILLQSIAFPLLFLWASKAALLAIWRHKTALAAGHNRRAGGEATPNGKV